MTGKKITAVIVDDEVSARSVLKDLLETHCQQVYILGEADSVTAAKALIKATRPEVIFLDVEMPGGTGFDLLKDPSIQAEIIFTSAHNHYAINAIRSFALDYLLKPVNAEELIEAVAKVSQRDARVTYKLLDLLTRQVESKKDYPEQIAIPCATGLEIIKVQDIIYCEGDGNYTTVHLIPNGKIVSSKTLKEYERILSTQTFIRSHQKYLVNISHVKRYIKGRGGVLVMANGKSLDVAHSKRSQVIEALG